MLCILRRRKCMFWEKSQVCLFPYSKFTQFETSGINSYISNTFLYVPETL
ncbi:hypothetical protein X975_27112, partial [Stegodyphus mimosarum]